MPRVDAYDFPGDRWYEPREHLWALPARDGEAWLVTIGVDALGQEALGEVVYVQLGAPGQAVARGDALGSLEAEKMVRPILAPLSGVVAEVNAALLREPRLLNRDPYGAGWLLRLRARDWERERDALVAGDERIAAWARAEMEVLREQR